MFQKYTIVKKEVVIIEIMTLIRICTFSKIDPQVYLVMINHGAKAEINLPDIKR